MKKNLPQRSKLPHDIPAWIEQGVRHFITINCRNRVGEPLIQDNIPDRLIESARYYESIGNWFIWLMLIMPNHLHMIATFDLQHGIKNTLSNWKRYQATNLKIEWQTDFFEHRLRNEMEFEEKMQYIKMNPVRKGLVKTPTEWRFVLDRGSLGELALPRLSPI